MMNRTTKRSLVATVCVGCLQVTACDCGGGAADDAGVDAGRDAGLDAGADAARNDAARNDAARYDAARYDAARYDVARYDTARNDAVRIDTARPDGVVNDAAAIDSTGQDRHAASCGADAGLANDLGFCIRIPQTRDVEWQSFPSGTQIYPMLDVDYLCTLDYQSTAGFVYVQARATHCMSMGGCETTVDGAWTSIAGVIRAVSASYNWGGNHHNDSFDVDYDDNVLRYYHSSFGFGWRSCDDPDCIQVYQAGPGALIEDGCTSARTLPQACVQLQPDAGVPQLVDDFQKCLGDPNADAG